MQIRDNCQNMKTFECTAQCLILFIYVAIGFKQICRMPEQRFPRWKTTLKHDWNFCVKFGNNFNIKKYSIIV